MSQNAKKTKQVPLEIAKMFELSIHEKSRGRGNFENFKKFSKKAKYFAYKNEKMMHF